MLHMLKKKGQPQEYQPVILVTGCSTGIGLSLARKLWRLKQFRVVITARERSLERLKREPFSESDRFMIRPLDVKVGEQRQKLIQDIQKRWGGVDILVNNAGISYRAVVEHMDEAAELNQLRTNYLAPMALIRLVLPFMREKGRGKIINVSSVAGMLAMPTMSSYSASKYALEGASESLWYEMKPLGIDVCLIQPGFIHSKSFKNVHYSALSEAAEKMEGPYSDYYKNMAPFVERMMNWSMVTPEMVAAKILKAIRRPNPPIRVPATPDALVFYYLRRWLPRKFFHPFLFRMLPNAKHWARPYSKARFLKGG